MLIKDFVALHSTLTLDIFLSGSDLIKSCQNSVLWLPYPRPEFVNYSVIHPKITVFLQTIENSDFVRASQIDKYMFKGSDNQIDS